MSHTGPSPFGTDPARVALIGCGAVSRLYYAPALRRLEDAGLLRLEALYDPDQDAVARLNHTFPRARSLDTTAAVIKKDYDLAIIASPPAFHAEQAILALSQGVHVLCEKPMAPSAAECRAMVDAALASDAVLAVGFVRRFFPAVHFIGELLARQSVGQLESFYVFEGGPFAWPTVYPNYFARAGSVGGVLLDVGVHTLDLLHSWLGPPASFVYEDDAMGGIESNCLIRMEYESGVQGVVRLSRDWLQPNNYTFHCSEGCFSWSPGEPSALQVKLASSRQVLTGIISEPSTRDAITEVHSFEDAFVAQLLDVMSAIRLRQKPLVTGDAGLENVRFVNRLYAARTIIEMPWLSTKEILVAEKLHRASA